MKKVYQIDAGGAVDWVVAESSEHALDLWMEYVGIGEEHRQYYEFIECPDDEIFRITFIGDVAQIGLSIPDGASVEIDEDDDREVAIIATSRQLADSNKPGFLCSTEW